MVHIALHGTEAPTITCLSRTRPPIQARHTGSVTPDTSSYPCNSDENLIISIPNSPYNYCFSGSGYLGLNPGITPVVTILAEYNSWVRLYYNDAGTYFNVAGEWSGEWFYGAGSVYKTVGITQVCDDCGYHS